MRWPAVVLLGLGLVGAGCSATGPAPPTQAPLPPPPPATQQLVRWTDGMCTLVKGVDQVRSSAQQLGKPLDVEQASGFLRQIAGWVNESATALKDLGSTGIPSIDAYAANLGKWHADVTRSATDGMKGAEADKITTATGVAGALTGIEPAKDSFAALAGQTREVVASYDVAPNCEPVRASAQRDLVAWADGMCTAVKSLSTLRTDPLADPAVSDPRFQQAAWAALGTYISSAGSPLGDVSTQLNAVKPIGVAEADAYRTALLTAVESAMAKLPQGARTTDLFQLPIDQLKAKATEVAGILATAKPPEPGLAAIVVKDEKLKAAHGLAPSCGSPQETPVAAANGTDLSACQSGKCQVQITGAADVTAGGFTVKVTVTGSGVTVTDSSRVLNLGARGEGSFGDANKTLAVKVAGLTGNTAIVDITAS